MINVRAIYLGNEAEAYILDDFIDGINIINSDDNHVGKTIVMQSCSLWVRKPCFLISSNRKSTFS